MIFFSILINVLPVGLTLEDVSHSKRLFYRHNQYHPEVGPAYCKPLVFFLQSAANKTNSTSLNTLLNVLCEHLLKVVVGSSYAFVISNHGLWTHPYKGLKRG
jgi:hypothetical protein